MWQKIECADRFGLVIGKGWGRMKSGGQKGLGWCKHVFPGEVWRVAVNLARCKGFMSPWNGLWVGGR